MADIILKELLGRPRTFTTVDSGGKEITLRVSARGKLIISDSRLVTGEMLNNIKRASLLLVSGVIPDKPNTYPFKKPDFSGGSKNEETKAKTTASIKPQIETESVETEDVVKVGDKAKVNTTSKQ